MPIEINDHDGKAKTATEKSSLSEQVGQIWKQLNARKISSIDRMLFTEQLALLLETGINLREALQLLQKQTGNPAMAELIVTLIDNITEGKSFSYALKLYPKVFDSSYVSLVAASEKGGFLPKVLKELLAMDDKRQRLQSTLVSALTYPVFLIVFSFAVVVFILVAVFPKFADMFSAIYDQLPITTRVLMAISDLFIQQWPYILGVIAIFILVFRQYLSSEKGRYLIALIKLKLPFMRGIFIELYLVNSLRLMGQALGNGVPVLETLGACRDIVNNSLYRDFIHRVEDKVREGSGIASAFKDEDFIPSMVYQMVATGEETGNLSLVMAKVADFYEKRLEQRLSTVAKVAEPLMLVVMGAIVGILVSSLILPIFSLSKAVH